MKNNKHELYEKLSRLKIKWFIQQETKHYYQISTNTFEVGYMNPSSPFPSVS